MRYAFLLHVDEPAFLSRSEAEIRAAMERHVPYIEMLRKNQKYGRSHVLGPSSSARTLRKGSALVTEGPYAESHEQFGGFYVVDARDLDEAIGLARECPALGVDHVLSLEIR